MELMQIKPSPEPTLSPDGLQVFHQAGQLRHIKRGTLIYSPGDHASHVYLISQGEVKLSRYTPEGRELTLDHLSPGEIFGETEILLETLRESQAMARADVTAYVLDSDTLLQLIADHPRFGFWMTRFMGARQARMENRLESLLFKSASGKVAQVLLTLATEHGRDSEQGTLIDYPITHQEIGNLIATTRETVSYAFMEFRQLGLISTSQRRTVVHDLDALGELAQG
ncbi:MAG: Crp/Fnr family transcriptional regulator [Candidatus Lambdaproteobacteria bacterium]|nr:Crp/Fnr family transcriptional regulator [Candidatus Lambdaproteobacteria bacterium]